MRLGARLFLAACGCALPCATMLPSVAAADMASQGNRTDIAGRAPEPLRANDERHIVDARLPPHAAVGRLKGIMTCTAAVVVHPRIVLTAGHCIASAGGSSTSLKAYFQPGYQAGTDLGRFAAKVWDMGVRQDFASQSVHEASNDWAVLLLERAPIGIRPLLLSAQSADVLRGLGRQVLMPSYSIDIAGAQALSLDPACSVRKRAWNVLIHDCKTSSGGSGAPLLVRERGWYAVVGIHSAAILERDEQHRTMRLLGQEATGAWTFAHAVHALSARLKSADNLAISGPLAH